MLIHVLNLDRRPDRWKAFCENNGHLSTDRRVSCIDGPTLGREALLRRGVDLEKLPHYSLATAGNQLSHAHQWRLASVENRNRHIAEDDAVFREDFETVAQDLLSTLPDNWDIVFWGHTFACPVSIEITPGGRSVMLATSSPRETDERATFKVPHYDPSLYRCYTCYNSFAYSISPLGAEKILSKCMPMRDEHGVIAPTQNVVPIYGVDAKLSAIAGQLQAYYCFPPIAMHLHDPAQSDMLPDGSPIRDTRDELPKTLPAPFTTND